MAATDGRCRWVRRRLPLLAGGELVGPERRRVERHLIGCPACVARRDAARRSLSFLREVGSFRPGAGASGDAPPLWPDLARQIREARHDSGRASGWPPARRWRPRLVAALVGPGLAAGLALAWAAAWGPSARPTGPAPAADRPGPVAAARPPAATSAAAGRDEAYDSDFPWSNPLEPEFPLARLDPRPSALPRANPAGNSAAPRPGVDPFEPPMPLRFDFDLDRGTLSGPLARDTQRAY